MANIHKAAVHTALGRALARLASFGDSLPDVSSAVEEMLGDVDLAPEEEALRLGLLRGTVGAIHSILLGAVEPMLEGIREGFEREFEVERHAEALGELWPDHRTREEALEAVLVVLLRFVANHDIDDSGGGRCPPFRSLLDGLTFDMYPRRTLVRDTLWYSGAQALLGQSILQEGRHAEQQDPP